MDGPIAQWDAWWGRVAEHDPLARLASASGFVLTTRALAELGMARGSVRWELGNGTFTRAGHGLVAPIDIRTGLPKFGVEHVLGRRRHALLGAGAALARPDDAVSGLTAAIMHGLPTMSVPDVPVLNSRSPGSMGRRASNALRAGTLDRHQVTTWFGIELSDVARTLIDLGRRNGRDAIMAADAALRENRVTIDQLERALALARQWPGVCRAREVLALADPRSESPLESITRLALHDAGFPTPELQYWIGPDRVDFYWPRYRLVLEADGRLKYTAEERWAEKIREQRLRRDRNRVERVTWGDVVARWPDTVHLLAEVLPRSQLAP